MITTRIPLHLLCWLPQGADGVAEGQDEGTTEDTTDDAAEEDVTDEDGDATETVSKKEFLALQRKLEQMKTHLSAADKHKSTAQKELEEIKRKERTDLENAQEDIAKHQKASEEWRSKFLDLARTNAFLIGSARAKVAWHDPEVAQGAAGLAALTVADDGTVEGIEEVVKKLAKEKPFLVNTKSTDVTEDGDERPKSGSRVGASGKKNIGTKNGLTPEELRKRFPALRQ